MSRALPARELADESRARVFREALHDAGLPQPILEFKFAFPGRRWAFDYAWPMPKIALEVEGGVWTKGRHTRGAGFLKDVEKYNAAAVLGWRVVRCTPDTLCSAETLDMLRALMPPSNSDCPALMGDRVNGIEPKDSPFIADPDACPCRRCAE